MEARDQSNEIFKTASQAQMRACAFQWREMKRTGKAAGKIWRDFARVCLSGL
jgi:ribosomal protein L20